VRLETFLHRVEKHGFPQNDFELRRHAELLERSQRRFDELCTLKDDVSSLIDSRVAETDTTESGRGLEDNKEAASS
jgi:hypothetical protein